MGGGGDSGWMPPPLSNSMTEDDGPAPVRGIMPKKGMALGKKTAAPMMDMFGPDSGPDPAASAGPVEEAAPAAPIVNPLLEPANVLIEEKITANLQMEGGI